MFRLICRLKESIDSTKFIISDKVFHSRMTDGRNELKYKAVLSVFKYSNSIIILRGCARYLEIAYCAYAKIVQIKFESFRQFTVADVCFMQIKDVEPHQEKIALSLHE